MQPAEFFLLFTQPLHLTDIRGMLAVSSEELDDSFLDAQITDLGLSAEWDLARQDPKD